MVEQQVGNPVRSGQLEDAPVVVYVQQLLEQAVAQSASDLHFEPYEQSYRVRMRIDGQLREAPPAPLAFRDRLAARIKVMARLDVAEKRLPQDGGISVRTSGKRIDVRLSTIPTLFGESAVMRLLIQSQGMRNLDESGMPPASAHSVVQRLTSGIAMAENFLSTRGRSSLRRRAMAASGASAPTQ